MSDELTAQQAVAKLRQLATVDPDVQAALHMAYQHYQVRTPGELARDHPEFVLDLYDSALEMLADVEAMESADDRSRGRLAQARAVPSE